MTFFMYFNTGKQIRGRAGRLENGAPRARLLGWMIIVAGRGKVRQRKIAGSGDFTIIELAQTGARVFPGRNIRVDVCGRDHLVRYLQPTDWKFLFVEECLRGGV